MTFAFAPALALCAAFAAGVYPTVTSAAETAEIRVTVLGRTWIVSPAEDAPGRFRAERLNLELDAFRPPAMISARQAARAIRAATGCSARRDTMVRTISGVYFADLNCPDQ